MGDYIGIGPGAHGRITRNGKRIATEAYASPAKWLAETPRGTTEKVHNQLSGAEQADEYVMMGLRITDGIDPRRYEGLAGRPLDQSAVGNLQEIGMIIASDARIRVTDKGRMVLNAVIKEFLSGT